MRDGDHCEVKITANIKSDDMRRDYQRRRLLLWTVYSTRALRTRRRTTTHPPHTAPNVLRDCDIGPDQCPHPHAQHATLVAHVASVASPPTATVSSAIPARRSNPKPARLHRPSLAVGAAFIVSVRAQGIFSKNPPYPLDACACAHPTYLHRCPQDMGTAFPIARVTFVTFVTSPHSAHRDRLSLRGLLSTQEGPHTPDGQLLTPPPLSIERAVFITCPFAATIIIAIRPSRLTPAPLVHSPQARRPFVITGAAFFAPTRTTTIGSGDSASMHNARARAHPQYEAHHHRRARWLFLIPNVAGVAPPRTATIRSVTPIPGSKSVFV
ncbi:hypothetical protein DFH09DRAFT_1327191 [Mycena vulgaris]|nr:hypothetical protein DFH09DRAFT_1327191 [Mycena vulgaris]